MKKVTAAIIEKEGKILITQRSKEDKLCLKWEFPGGKIEKNETPEECLIREIKEELNLDIKVTGHFMNNNYRYETGEIELMSYFAEITGGELKLNVHEAAELFLRIVHKTGLVRKGWRIYSLGHKHILGFSPIGENPYKPFGAGIPCLIYIFLQCIKIL